MDKFVQIQITPPQDSRHPPDEDVPPHVNAAKSTKTKAPSHPSSDLAWIFYGGKGMVRYLLLLFKLDKRTNYFVEAFNLLAQYGHAHAVNMHGRAGKNTLCALLIFYCAWKLSLLYL